MNDEFTRVGGGRRPDEAGKRKKPRLVALDLDGVVYRGGVPLPGAKEALAGILERGLDLRYVTNNSTAHRRVVSERLARMGLAAGEDRVFTSGYATARWLRARLPAGAPVMVVGEAGLLAELREKGLPAFRAGEELPCCRPGTASKEDVAAVVVGMDREFTFTMLAAAQQAVRGGALFIATNPDATFPTPEGLLPGAGALVAAVATAAQRQPVLIGKPSPILAEILVEATGIAAEETVFVGDRVSTDIVMGCEAGMVTVLVLTGIAAPGEPRNALADFVIPDLSGLLEVIDELRA